MVNYFNILNLCQQLVQLGKCCFMVCDEFVDGVSYFQGKKVVIVGCGVQGLNQGLNMCDFGLDIFYVLCKEVIVEKCVFWCKVIENGFKVGIYEELILQVDLVVNLMLDKQYLDVVCFVQLLMKDGVVLGYFYGFNIVEVGEQICKDIIVVMVVLKCLGIEVCEEYKCGFGVLMFIVVYLENDLKGEGMVIVKVWVVVIGGYCVGVLEFFFVVEVKFDLMGE